MVWNLEITDEEADEAFDRYKDGDYDDTPEIPAAWDTGEL